VLHGVDRVAQPGPPQFQVGDVEVRLGRHRALQHRQPVPRRRRLLVALQRVLRRRHEDALLHVAAGQELAHHIQVAQVHRVEGPAVEAGDPPRIGHVRIGRHAYG
jgi:hypothetical protein